MIEFDCKINVLYLVLPLDLTNASSISNFVQVLEARAVDRVDLLINNAG